MGRERNNMDKWREGTLYLDHLSRERDAIGALGRCTEVGWDHVCHNNRIRKKTPPDSRASEV